ncbi:organic cation transporter-like protein [Lytechinus variegatus]|uniref:organic cation transporter-like protein n=1 Tax=Lytechinus variegatus TaxID=7654 RepID=UPI001BB0DA37|nr:organic cation transporter-like protein [Lytechinus variegatus]
MENADKALRTKMIQANEEIPFDDILIEYGEFGRYQKWIYSLLCLFILVTPAQALIMGFLSEDVDHWCKRAEWESIDCGRFGFNTSRQCDLGKRAVGIPWNYTDNDQTEKVYSSCTRYNTHGVEFSPDLDLDGYPVMPCDSGWKYGEVESGGTTLIKDFDAVCGQYYFVSLAQTLYFVGTGFGSIFIGVLSDRFGRRTVAFLCLVSTILSGVGLAFSPNIIMFLVLRCVVGVTNSGILYSTVVHANEIVGPSKRNWAGNVVWCFFAIGIMGLALLAYLIRNWRYLQLTVSVIPVLLLITWLTIPESPRWLLMRGRKKEAEDIIKRLARWNKVEIKESFNMDKVAAKSDEGGGLKRDLVELFRHPKLRCYTVNMMWQLFAVSSVYYGISLGTGSLEVNNYVAFAVSGAVDIPAAFFGIFAIEYWSRRPTYMFLVLLCGAVLLASGFLTPGVFKTVLAMVGKFAIAAAFNIIDLRGCEILPTVVR